MRQRYYRSSEAALDAAINRGWARSKQEYGQWLADVYDMCFERQVPFVAVIVPRKTAQVEFATTPMVPDNHPEPKISESVLEDLRERATNLQANSRARRKDIYLAPSTGTIHGLNEDDAKELAAYIVHLLRDPSTFADSGVVGLTAAPDPEGVA